VMIQLALSLKHPDLIRVLYEVYIRPASVWNGLITFQNSIAGLEIPGIEALRKSPRRNMNRRG